MASRTNNGLARICNYICVVLMLVILVFQFLPFWHYSTEEESFATSIQTYIWFPGERRDLDHYLAEQTGNEDIEAGQILGMPILVLCERRSRHRASPHQGQERHRFPLARHLRHSRHLGFPLHARVPAGLQLGGFAGAVHRGAAGQASFRSSRWRKRKRRKIA